MIALGDESANDAVDGWIRWIHRDLTYPPTSSNFTFVASSSQGWQVPSRTIPRRLPDSARPKQPPARRSPLPKDISFFNFLARSTTRSHVLKFSLPPAPQMLDAAEAEFFGQQQDQDGAAAAAAGVAEAKPAAPHQAYFKSAKGDGGVSRGGGTGGSDVAGAAQSKSSRQRPGGAGGGFKGVRSEGEWCCVMGVCFCLWRTGWWVCTCARVARVCVCFAALFAE